ncbi:hypothetical protein BLA29_006986, partial [Euroglyphus maynei]
MPRTKHEFDRMKTPVNKCNLNRSLLKIAINDVMPICKINDKLTDGKQLTLDPSKSADLMLLQSLSVKWNFTYEFINAGQNWGTYKNHTWTGTVGLLMDGQADVGMCATSMTYSRSM